MSFNELLSLMLMKSSWCRKILHLKTITTYAFQQHSWAQLTVPKTFRLDGGKVLISKMNPFVSNGTDLPHKY